MAEERLPHVHDTWKNRSDEERLGNLATGYLAERILRDALDDAGVTYIDYDDTRIDNLENDDPFDFIVLPPDYDDVERLTAWLQDEIYPNVNSQGRMRRPVKVALYKGVHDAGGYVADLKSSIDNHDHGIEAIVHEQHHIAYATQKNQSGWEPVSGPDYLEERGDTFNEYWLRKSVIKDVHFRVFFSGPELLTGYYVGFVRGRELVVDGEVGPFPPRPWVLYHRKVIASCNPPGSEVDVLFG